MVRRRVPAHPMARCQRAHPHQAELDAAREMHRSKAEERDELGAAREVVDAVD